jgi:hypothetical protein
MHRLTQVYDRAGRPGLFAGTIHPQPVVPNLYRDPHEFEIISGVGLVGKLDPETHAPGQSTLAPEAAEGLDALGPDGKIPPEDRVGHAKAALREHNNCRQE